MAQLASAIYLRRRTALLAVASLALTTLRTNAQSKRLVIGSTTSPEDSGLFAHLLPIFAKATGIDSRVVAVGTGRALELARQGNVDVLLVHDRVAEDEFLAEGIGLARRNVMYNDFVLIGPKSDPAGARGRNIVAALRKIADAPQAKFISCGDNSGTHTAELRYWKAAGIDPEDFEAMRYHDCNCNVGLALSIAAARGMYVLADRGTWIAARHPGDLAVLVEGDARLFNQYSVILVNPRRRPQDKREPAQAFADWLVSPQGRQAIASYKIDGEQLFFPNPSR